MVLPKHRDDNRAAPRSGGNSKASDTWPAATRRTNRSSSCLGHLQAVRHCEVVWSDNMDDRILLRIEQLDRPPRLRGDALPGPF